MCYILNVMHKNRASSYSFYILYFCVPNGNENDEIQHPTEQIDDRPNRTSKRPSADRQKSIRSSSVLHASRICMRYTASSICVRVCVCVNARILQLHSTLTHSPSDLEYIELNNYIDMSVIHTTHPDIFYIGGDIPKLKCISPAIYIFTTVLCIQQRVYI